MQMFEDTGCVESDRENLCARYGAHTAAFIWSDSDSKDVFCVSTPKDVFGEVQAEEAEAIGDEIEGEIPNDRAESADMSMLSGSVMEIMFAVGIAL